MARSSAGQESDGRGLINPYSCIKWTRREHFQTLVMRVLLELNGLKRTSPKVNSGKVDGP